MPAAVHETQGYSQDTQVLLLKYFPDMHDKHSIYEVQLIQG